MVVDQDELDLRRANAEEGPLVAATGGRVGDVDARNDGDGADEDGREEDDVPYRLAWQSGSGGVWTLGAGGHPSGSSESPRTGRQKGRGKKTEKAVAMQDTLDDDFQSSMGMILPHNIGVEIVELEEGGMDVYVRWSTGEDLLTYIRRSYDREGVFTGAAMVCASAVASDASGGDAGFPSLG